MREMNEIAEELTNFVEGDRKKALQLAWKLLEQLPALAVVHFKLAKTFDELKKVRVELPEIDDDIEDIDRGLKEVEGVTLEIGPAVYHLQHFLKRQR